MYLSSMITEVLISLVLIIWMLMPSCDRVWNIRLATPTCERMPMPTMETLATFSSVDSSRAPTAGMTSRLSRSTARANSLRFTVNEKSVVPATDWFCTIMSTSMLAAATGPRMEKAMPGLSGTPSKVILASSRLKAMPETTAASIFRLPQK